MVLVQFRGLTIIIAIVFVTHFLISDVESIDSEDFSKWKCARICTQVRYNVDKICKKIQGVVSGDCNISLNIRFEAALGLNSWINSFKIGACKNGDGTIVQCVSAAQSDNKFRLYNYVNGVCEDTGSEYPLPE